MPCYFYLMPTVLRVAKYLAQKHTASTYQSRAFATVTTLSRSLILWEVESEVAEQLKYILLNLFFLFRNTHTHLHKFQMLGERETKVLPWV